MLRPSPALAATALSEDECQARMANAPARILRGFMSLLLRAGRMMTCPHDGLSGCVHPDRRQTSETPKSRARIEACASSRPRSFSMPV
jgi:hypothetical protein